MTNLTFKRMLLVVVTAALVLVLSTSVNMAGADGPDVESDRNLVVPAGLPDGVDIARLVKLAKWLAVSAKPAAQRVDVEDAEQEDAEQPGPVGSPLLPVDDFDVTSVMVAYSHGGVPCFNCVTGAATSDIGLSFPRARVSPGQSVEYTVLRKVGSAHTGTCTVVFLALRLSDNQVIDYATYQTTCPANTTGYTSWGGRAVPNVPGDAILLAYLVAQDGTTDVNYSLFKIY